MTQIRPVKIGFFLAPVRRRASHASFKKFIPPDIDFTFMQESGTHTSLYDAQGKVDALIQQARQLIAVNGWHGVIISGGPKEALNPGMWEQVSAALDSPGELGAALVGGGFKSFSPQSGSYS